MNKRIILTAAFLGGLAVMLGAFGAHSLKALISVTSLEIWQKGVEYQFYHVFALLYLSTFARYKNKLIGLSYIFFTLGIILFSGSLYLLALKDIYHFSAQFIGPITPIGGLCFILGWVCLFLAALKDK
ncbi:DUF423 domain-containing protein [Pedobacter frigiditerrae]|uniref:DUF423 domain-containing protein n=1 Tax=Pedobacter frigiditerrae TaxID=2530452 RepID=A0A4R0MT75_9SPHI|nr:DUF423 domain-containing protein [Pedobacter frigiditerrae]TCC89134.1 DUF423 domain-containing protein [Pedobacter frigiditerrae]